MLISRISLITLVIAMPLWVGCGGTESGPDSVLLQGKVTLDDQPVEEGDIYLRAKDGGNSYAGKIVDGTYELKTSPGDKRVEIVAYRDVPGEFREDNPGEKTPVRKMIIPKQYNTETTLEISIPADSKKAEENFPLATRG